MSVLSFCVAVVSVVINLSLTHRSRAMLTRSVGRKSAVFDDASRDAAAIRETQKERKSYRAYLTRQAGRQSEESRLSPREMWAKSSRS